MGSADGKRSGGSGAGLRKALRRSFFLANACVLPLGAAAPSAAAMLGDFAPLRTGNKWVFSRTYSLYAPWYSTNETGTRTVVVGEATARADTLVYTVSVVDSSRYDYKSAFATPDISKDSIHGFTVEIREAANGSLLVIMQEADKNYPHDCMLESAFMSHAFEASKARPDTSGPAPGMVVDTSVDRCPDDKVFTPVNGALKLKQGLGLWTYSGSPTFIHPSTQFSYQLRSFNATSFVGVKKPRRSGNYPHAGAGSRGISRFRWQGRNALGRILVPIPAP